MDIYATNNGKKQTESISNIITQRDKHLFKVVIIGNISVGKTCIIQRLMGKGFLESQSTIGVEFGEIEVRNIEENVDISIQVWDTSGAERYRALTTSHIRNADGTLLVYDVSDYNSFKALDYWIDSIKKYNSENIVIYLLGNKIDLEIFEINNNEIDEFKQKYNILKSYFISAKSDINISNMFIEFYTDVYNVQKDYLKVKSQKYKKLKEKRISKFNEENNKCCGSKIV